VLAGVTSGATAVVIGDGAVGLCAVLAATRTGAGRSATQAGSRLAPPPDRDVQACSTTKRTGPRRCRSPCFMMSLGELVNRFHHQLSIDQAEFLQCCDVPPARDKPARLIATLRGLSCEETGLDLGSGLVGAVADWWFDPARSSGHRAAVWASCSCPRCVGEILNALFWLPSLSSGVGMLCSRLGFGGSGK
jgi:hypothetical protein